jgi:chaperonin GroES
MPKIKPLGKRVLIKRSKAQATKGGILLPDTAQEKPREGEVVAVGPGAISENGKLEALSVKVGDKIIYSNYAGTEVKTEENDAEYLILSEDDILCIKGE